jgi:hypothetical protein
VAGGGAPCAAGACAGAGAALGAAFGAAALAFGAAAGAAGAAGAWASALETSNVADIAVAANKAKTRPCGRTGAAKIRKFIAENPF